MRFICNSRWSVLGTMKLKRQKFGFLWPLHHLCLSNCALAGALYDGQAFGVRVGLGLSTRKPSYNLQTHSSARANAQGAQVSAWPLRHISNDIQRWLLAKCILKTYHTLKVAKAKKAQKLKHLVSGPYGSSQQFAFPFVLWQVHFAMDKFSDFV